MKVQKMLKKAISGTALMTSLLGALLIAPVTVNAAESSVESTPQEVKKLESAIRKLTGNATVTKTDRVIIIAPEIAEDGVEVGIKVKAGGLKNVQSITLLAPKNTNPMLASFGIPEGTASFIKSRVKLRASMYVTALVKADGKFYTTKKVVKLSRGGCGG